MNRRCFWLLDSRANLVSASARQPPAPRAARASRLEPGRTRRAARAPRVPSSFSCSWLFLQPHARSAGAAGAGRSAGPGRGSGPGRRPARRSPSMHSDRGGLARRGRTRRLIVTDASTWERDVRRRRPGPCNAWRAALTSTTAATTRLASAARSPWRPGQLAGALVADACAAIVGRAAAVAGRRCARINRSLTALVDDAVLATGARSSRYGQAAGPVSVRPPLVPSSSSLPSLMRRTRDGTRYAYVTSAAVMARTYGAATTFRI